MKTAKMLFCFLVVFFAFSFTDANAQTPLDVSVNGNFLKMASDGFIADSTAMVGIRSISEVLGSDEIKWNEKDKSVEVIYKENELYIPTQKGDARINGKKVNVPYKVIFNDSKTYVSARFICDFFDADISWDKMRHTVNITKDSLVVEDKYIDKSYTKNDLEWLAKIVHAEAQGEPDEGKIAVGNVVMNRKASKEFPDTVYDVVFDRKFGVQFTPVANGAIYNNPSIESYHAAKKALFGENVVGKSLYFCNLSISSNMWIPNNRTFFTKIGKHSFYL